jgi:hypothetical protein
MALARRVEDPNKLITASCSLTADAKVCHACFAGTGRASLCQVSGSQEEQIRRIFNASGATSINLHSCINRGFLRTALVALDIGGSASNFFDAICVHSYTMMRSEICVHNDIGFHD